MDAIKKKMLAMKMEKEVATDKAEQTEQSLRDLEDAKNKTEEDLSTLQKKYSNLENDFDNAKEQLTVANTNLEASEKRVAEDQYESGLSITETQQAITGTTMVDKSPAEQDIYPTDPLQLSQESQCTQDSDCGLTGSPMASQEADTGQSPAKEEKKKKKKKKDKDKDKEGKDGKKEKKKKKSSRHKDGDEKEHKSKKSSSRRPEPEGGNSTSMVIMDEYDKVIYGNEPIFSDLELSDKEEGSEQSSSNRPRRPTRMMGTNGGSGIIFPCLQFGINSNTMIKFAIIGTELQNVLQVSLKRCESEIQGLNRRIQLLEEDLERSEERFSSAQSKLEDASKAADESERGRKVLENRSQGDEERIDLLEKQLEEAKWIAEDADRKFDEAARKLAITEVDLERAEARLEAAEARAKELEDEMNQISRNLKTLQINEAKASQREDSYEETIRDLTHRLKEAENRAAEAERTVSKLQKEVDRLEDELLAEKERYKTISDELDQTFAELAGY